MEIKNHDFLVFFLDSAMYYLKWIVLCYSWFLHINEFIYNQTWFLSTFISYRAICETPCTSSLTEDFTFQTHVSLLYLALLDCLIHLLLPRFTIKSVTLPVIPLWQNQIFAIVKSQAVCVKPAFTNTLAAQEVGIVTKPFVSCRTSVAF